MTCHLAFSQPVRLLSLFLLTLLLAACGVSIEGGVEPPTTPGAMPTVAEPTATPTAEPSPEVASEPDAATPTRRAAIPTVETSGTAFRIGLQEEPADLLPYHTNAADERVTAPISELLFPAPVLSLDYHYTATNVLERLPSFANGDIDIQEVDVYLDPMGAITTEETDVITDAQQIVITYRWNPALRWSDGVTVTADDSLFAYELAQQIPLGEQASQRLNLLERYEKVDEHTTRAFLLPDLPDVNEEISPTIEPDLTNTEYLLTFWTPLPRHVLEDSDHDTEEFFSSDFALQPVSYGPYVVEQRTPDTVRLQRNPYYPEPYPEADAVAFVFSSDLEELQESVQNGSLDLIVADGSTPEDLQALTNMENEPGNLDVSYVPAPIWEHLDFNMSFALLRDVRARQAIAYGTNRQAMAEQFFAGQVPVLDSWILPEHWAAAPPDQITAYPYDPDRARELLDELDIVDLNEDGIREQGIDHDSDGTLESSVPITLSLLTTEGSTLRSAIAEQFQADMAAIGLTVTVQLTSTERLFSPDGPLFRRQFELAQFAWIASPDPRGFDLWSCAAIPRETNNWSGSNLPGWCSREANQAIITATTSLHYAERRAAYLIHQQHFTEELPVLPLFQRLTVVISNPGLHGLQPDPIAPITWNITEWARE